MGRPTVMSPRVAANIVQAVAGGASRVEAAAAAGIGKRTLQTWLAEAREDRARPGPDRLPFVHRHLLAELERLDREAARRRAGGVESGVRRGQLASAARRRLP